MALIRDIIWREHLAARMASKHGVAVHEAEELLRSSPVFRKLSRGRVRGEDVCAAMGQIGSGRYLIVFFILGKRGRAMPVSARNIDAPERQYHAAHKQTN